jgi:hypothetical protein
LEPVVSTAKSWSASFSATTPLHTVRRGIAHEEVRQLPLNYLRAHCIQTLVDLDNINVFAPRLLAFAGRLLVLRRGGHGSRHVEWKREGEKSE